MPTDAETFRAIFRSHCARHGMDPDAAWARVAGMVCDPAAIFALGDLIAAERALIGDPRDDFADRAQLVGETWNRLLLALTEAQEGMLRAALERRLSELAAH